MAKLWILMGLMLFLVVSGSAAAESSPLQGKAGAMGIVTGNNGDRNPFLQKSNSIARLDYELAASRIELHGLIQVGEVRCALVAVAEEGRDLLNYRRLSEGKKLRVFVNGTEYEFTAHLKANAVVLRGANQKDYEVEL